MTFLDLPMGIIRRILYFVCTSPGLGCEELRIGKMTDLLNMLFTCKELYEDYVYMVYTVRPLVLTDDSISLMNFVGRKTGKRHGSRCMTHIGSKMSIRENIRVLNIVTSSGLFHRKYRQKPDIAICQLENAFKLTRFDMLLVSYLPRFRILHTLNISGRHIKLMLYFCFLPDSLKSITVFIDYRERNFNNSDMLRSVLLTIENSTSNPTLEYFQVYSTHPIMQTRIHSHFCLVKGKSISSRNEYFSNQVVSKYENYNFKRKKGLVLFGIIIYKLLDKFRKSLKSIELGKLDFSLVFNSNTFNSPRDRVEYDFHFPALRLLVIDNVSSLKLNTWISDFQEENSNFRNHRPLFIAMYDDISGYLHTKTVCCKDKHNVIRAKWLHSKDPDKTMKSIKRELEINL